MLTSLKQNTQLVTLITLMLEGTAIPLSRNNLAQVERNDVGIKIDASIEAIQTVEPLAPLDLPILEFTLPVREEPNDEEEESNEQPDVSDSADEEDDGSNDEDAEEQGGET